MKTVRIQLTPVGHYFFGGERGFGYDKQLNRQMADSYYISSLKVPGQTSLFGTLRYLIGVKDERLREDSGSLIGNTSYDIAGNNEDFGIIKGISPLYLFNDGTDNEKPKGYYIKTPFDHKTADYIVEGDKKKRIVNTNYKPLEVNNSPLIETINYPNESVIKKKYPLDYNAKDGISHSYMSIDDKTIVYEDDIFVSSVEVVSKKNKSSNDNNFAKKGYYRLNKGWSFVFFAGLNTDSVPEYNRSVVMGKDSSVFKVYISEEEEPEIHDMFKDRGGSFYYAQSPIYITDDILETIADSDFCITENENLRRFTTERSKLHPVYNTNLIQLICAGSVFYMSDKTKLENRHAVIAGFNRLINGGI